MPGICDIPGFNLACQAVGGAAGAVAESAFTAIAETAGQWAGEMIVHAMTWWVQTPTADPNSAAVREAQQWTVPLVMIMLMAAVLWQSGRMILSRRKEPLVTLGVGLVRYAVITTLGLVILGGAVAASDALASAMVQDTALDFGKRMKEMLTLAMLGNPFGLLILGLLLALVALTQWVIGFIRQAGILVLAVMIPLAASGSLTETTKAWWPKLASSLLALVAYKPAAAVIYMIGFTFMSKGQSFTTFMIGAMVLVLALFALPALMKFFSWAETRISASGSSGSGFAGAAGAMGARGAQGSSGSSGSSSMQSSGPGSRGSSPGAFGEISGSSPSGASGGGSGSNPPAGVGAASSGGTSGGSGGFGAASGGGTSGGAAGGGSSAAAGSSGGGAAGAGAASGVGAALQAKQRAQQMKESAANEMTSGSGDEQSGG